MKKTALIGYTGFVGSNLLKQTNFDDLYNSKNIVDIKGKEYDVIVSAGTRAERWKANQDPEGDWNSIKRLLDNLEGAKATIFILISTVDVYPNPVGVDEDSIIDEVQLTQAYGRNRYMMERFVLEHFPKVTIVRCPQLYGDGLKKNFIYDLIHDNALDFTHKDTTLQVYHLENMWQDIQTAVENNIPLINFAVEPISAGEIARFTRGIDFETVTEKPPMKFDFQTKYATVYGKAGVYLYDKQTTLAQLKDFISTERRKAGK